MALYTAGLSSGVDWTTMISQLMAIERQPITDMNTQKKALQTRQSAWSEVNTKLSALKGAASAISELDDFNLHTSSSTITGSDKKVSDLLSFVVGSTASQGSYSIKVNNLAQAQKLSSKGFSSTTTALGLSGDILINGRAVSLTSTDTLKNIQDKINASNSGTNASGVTASIFSAADGEYRLTITSLATGADGIDIVNASSEDLLGKLGMADTSVSLSHPITGGARSREFSSSTQALGSLMGLGSAASGTVRINGQALSIDLASDSLASIASKLTSAGVNATVVADSSSGTTGYTLQIDGLLTNPDGSPQIIDENNVLQTLGFVKQGHDPVSGLTGSVKNTSSGKAITSSTLLVDIDGYQNWTSGDKITISGKKHNGSDDITPSPIEFAISQTSTVDDLLTYIENAYGDTVDASINSDGTLVIEDKQSGESNLTLALSATKADGETSIGLSFGTFAASTLRSREVVAGEDAKLVVDGVSVTRSSNQITDVIGGVTIDLKGEDADSTINLSINRDYSSIEKLVSDFVSKYNDVVNYVNDQSKVTTSADDSTTTSTPTLFGDSSLLGIMSELRGNILGAVSGVSSSYAHLSSIGISIDKTGVLSVNNDKLDSALRSNFDDVVNLFATHGSSATSSLTYVSSGRDTVGGKYDVEITTAATQASLIGVTSISSLAADSMIAIKDYAGKEAQVTLKAGWNITAIVNAINSELSQNYAEVRVGANKLYADTDGDGASNNVVITSDTKWSNVYNAGGVGAGLANGDVISFSGTDHNGKAVSGSYSIADTSSGTIGDLLTQIEDAYGTGYDAYVDSEGRIAIKDNTVGGSSLTLAISTTKNLDFGAIGVDPTGADGSREGRFSLDVTAVNDGGKLKIYNKDYGSYGLTVTASGSDELGLNSGTKVDGLDVAGRIRKSGSSTWQTMTGKGQSLTGDDGQDVADLVIKYTGSTVGTYDFTLTSGVGAKMDRSTYYMTDSVSGYVAGKQAGFTSQLNSIDKRIENIERRVEIRQTALFNQFVAMEKMISTLNSQKSYITGMLS